MRKTVSRGKSQSKKRAKPKKVRPKTVHDNLVSVPEPARSTLNKVRAAIQSVVPANTTEVISYGIPAFRYKRILMWYAAFSGHCSVFPTASVIEKFRGELKPFRTSKGTIHFPIDKALPSALVKKIAKMRVAEVEDKKGR
jgi:uncharacterized protein YdhG (YjbR/CyaY superfamily)